MNKRTKISVGVITYNQQETIAQTLDSLLNQKGEFDLEVVVGEDCSPDGTYAICADYAQRYPDVIPFYAHTYGHYRKENDVLLQESGVVPIYTTGNVNYNNPNHIDREVISNERLQKGIIHA